MTTTEDSADDLTPAPREVDMMAAVLEARHGVHADEVAQFFSDWNAHNGEAARAWAWKAVCAQLRRRTHERVAKAEHVG